MERLRYRGALRAVADPLHHAAVTLDLALDANRDLAFALDLGRDGVRALDRDLVHDLDYIRGRASSLENVNKLTRVLTLTNTLNDARDRVGHLDRTLGRALDRDLVRNLTLLLGRALDLGNSAFDLDRASELASDLADACDFANLLNRVGDLVQQLERHLDHASELARDLGVALTHDLGDLASHLDHARDLAFAHAPNRVRDRDLIEAHGNLVAAANDFTGADFSTVDPSDVNLVGIRWDSNTRWPTPEWGARITRASVEDPPGSGVFVVLPEEGRNFVGRGSLAPIS